MTSGTQGEKFIARKRALTPEKFYMDVQDIQDKPTELQIPGSHPPSPRLWTAGSEP